MNYLDKTVLSTAPTDFVFSSLFRADESPEFVKLERMGGLLTYLLSEYERERNSSFKLLPELPITPNRSFYFSIFNKAIILFNYAIISEFATAVRGFDKFVWKLDNILDPIKP